MATVQEKIKLMKDKLEHVRQGGGPKRIESQHSKGKLTARERLDLLFDEGTFVELDALVHHRCTNFGQDKKELPGEGVVCGYGTVDGRLVYAFAQDFTVEGGSLGEKHAHKIWKVQDLSMKMGAPCVGLNDSGGARIQEAVDALSGYGGIFFRNTAASGVIPQISAIMGPSAGGAVYSPAITDFIYMVKNTSQMFITGPAVIKSVTGEDVTAENLGGAMRHNSTSGVAHFACENDEDCIKQIRYLLSFLPSNNMEETPFVETQDSPTRMDEALNTIIPDNPNAPYDMKDVIRMIVDDGEFYEVHQYFAKNIITCFARFDGRTVGIIANEPNQMAGCLDCDASDKSARFIRFCDAFNIPLVNLVDVPGFLPGVNQEYSGIIRHGAKMLYAYSEATVPKITVILRKSYGGSYIAMCSREVGADQVIAWPSSEIAVMGPAGAANIIFKKDEPELKKQHTDDYVAEFATPYKAAERGYVDYVIEPKETRPRIIQSLNMLATKREVGPARKHGNIPL
ncbi:methylmalonyl-CoA decarboxylase subunit alpha [Schwartzia succinivorans]|jgi:methylmalonyl-CoA decarboxylase alpha subunit|uniref:Methylmalonyl-CoA decarboxylase alpha subunit n=1 Tax=Schwartzia succinivorans DSM 10502 TaxID=1123243 RepID=A0A1M4UEC8_9FIRM|nr:carboxyl transferase domain-containing protein [Schwartzia succinivorans]SHE55171.1 methylmalonyl-CoA decarboxylase alpha subunit [Schwartzia succinivorans DSM 10502]